MQQLKADLKYCQEVIPFKSTKKIKKNTSFKTASQKDKKFTEALEQSLLAAQTPLPTVVNVQKNTSRAAVTEGQKLKNLIKQTDNEAESKNYSAKSSDSGTIRGTVQNNADILAKGINAKPLGKMEKQDPEKQIKTDKGLDISLIPSKKAVSAIAGSKTSGAEKSDSQGIKSNFTLQNQLKAVDFANGKNISRTEDPTGQTVQQNLMQTQDTKSNFDISNSSMEKEHKIGENVKKIKNSTILKTPASKTNIGDNSVKTGVLELNTPETSESNMEKTTLSKSQTDLIISKMIQQIKVGSSSLEVSLKPEYLGKLSILLKSKDGLISVNFIAQNGEAMDLLNSNLQSIKDNLEQQGVKLQQMEVNVANQEKHGNQTGGSYRDGNRRYQSSVEIPQDHGYRESSKEFNLLPYKLNILA